MFCNPQMKRIKNPLIRRLRRSTFDGLAFGQLLLLIYITGKNFKTNVILLLNERWVFGGRKKMSRLGVRGGTWLCECLQLGARH